MILVFILKCLKLKHSTVVQFWTFLSKIKNVPYVPYVRTVRTVPYVPYRFWTEMSKIKKQ